MNRPADFQQRKLKANAAKAALDILAPNAVAGMGPGLTEGHLDKYAIYLNPGISRQVFTDMGFVDETDFQIHQKTLFATDGMIDRILELAQSRAASRTP